QRKLAAIMFTDMVGYSALSQRDEKLAQELLEQHRKLLRGIFPRFNGTEIKTIGDAFLVEFNSALEAAQCAIEIQRALAKRNADIAPDRRIELKIGIHIGDVVHRDGDVYGDGVNIASRIEPLAGAGGVCVSMDVERQIRNALEARFEKLAPTELKNISVAMDLFRIVLPWEQAQNAELGATTVRRRSLPVSRLAWIGAAVLLALAGAGWWIAHQSTSPSAPGVERTVGHKSIAVLPLVNTSGDPNNEYFSDGLSEELIAVLAKIPDLTVIGRSSSFLFKGQSSDSASIGQKLGVAHLIEGSVRRQGDRVRIVAELIQASNGRSLWSDTFDRELKDVFAVQSEIAQAVADQMKVKLLGEKPRSDAAPSNQNPAAYNAVLQSNFHFQQQTVAGLRQAISYAEEATRLDPNYALAWARLSAAWRQYGATFATDDADNEKAYAAARAAANKAISLAPNSVEALTAAGWVHMNPDLNFQAAEKQFRRALDLAPGHGPAKLALAYCLMAQGKASESERITREASSADPLLVNVWYNLGRLSLGAGRYQEAEETFRKALEIQPQAARIHTYLVTLDILRNNPTGAMQHAQEEPDGFWHDYAVALALQVGNDQPKADSALRSFSEKYATNGAYQVATLYGLRHEPDQMFQWLEKAYATHDSGLTQLSITPFIVSYRHDPRYIALCQKLGIQVSR
ncbi:MAG TPA: adenylate/guanylate cyclase domain-containing protein, partial [Chthoniobacterales bacterium]|nr:adenylate/guanylate cyclase domain-containing protein [Chthoniobacterales bacterium]